MASRRVQRNYSGANLATPVRTPQVFRTWRWLVVCLLLLTALPAQVHAQNGAVVADAGPDQVAEVGRRVELDGRASRGAGLTYRWRQIAGPTITLEAAAMPVAWFIYPFLPGLDVRTLAFELTITSSAGVTATDTTFVLEAILPPPPALSTVAVPEPTQLGNYVRNRQAAIQLGKALFWDMQVGSDGVQACASCHYAAGVDRRVTHQRHPGADGQFTDGALLRTFQASDFPFHQVRDPLSSVQEVVRSHDDVAGSQGVVRTTFVGVDPGARVDAGVRAPDPIFHVSGVNTRQVTARNAPSVINAVFNLRNFWDGRASYVFNGVNHLGVRDPQAHVWSVQNGAVAPEFVRLDKASLASQAVAPANNPVEMAWDGRRFPELGKKLLALSPLAGQRVDPTDSVLGVLAAPEGGLQTTYAALIQAAFAPRFWDTTDIIAYDPSGVATAAHAPGRPLRANEFTLMEANFALFFGLAIQLYEATLISDQTPYDRYQQGDTSALSAQQLRGQHLFMNVVQCVACHAGAEFTNATVSQFFAVAPEGGVDVGALIERMATADNTLGIYDLGFYNIGVRPTAEDVGIGGLDSLGNPLSASRLAQLGTPIGPPLTLNPPVNPSEYAAVAGAFKAPGLRNVALTAPYMHNGGMATLTQVVEFYARGSDFRQQNLHDLAPAIMPLPINRADVDDLVAFLNALTDERVRRAAAPFDHPQLFIPNGDGLLEVPAVGAAGGPPLESFVDGAPDFAVSLEAPTLVHAGAPLTATLNVTNTGAFNLRAVATATTLPGCNWGAPERDAWAADVVEIGEVWRMSCVTTVEASGAYTATTAATDKLGQHITLGAAHSFQVIRPALAVSIGPLAAVAAAGAPVTFTYTVTNTGDTPLTGVTLLSSLTGVHTPPVVALAPGAAATLVTTYTIPADATAPPQHQVRVRAQSVAGMEVVAEDTRVLSVLPAALQLTIEQAPAVVVGDVANYRVHIENTGALALYGLTLHAAQGSVAPLAMNELAPGAHISVTGALTASETALPGPLVESLLVSAHTVYAQPVTATQTLAWELETAPALALTHTLFPAAARIGETVTYSYVAANTGRVSLHHIALTSPRLGVLSVTDATLPPGAYIAGAHQFVVTEHDLPGPVSLRVEASGANAVVGASATTSGVLTLTLQPQPGLALTVQPPPTAAYSGETVTVRVQITNTGDVTLDQLVADAAPFGAVALRATQLAPGAATSGEVRVLITEAAQPGPAPLTVTARAASRYGGASLATTSSAQIALTRIPALAMEVTAPEHARIGEEIVAAVRLRNTGDATLSDFALQSVPAGRVEFVSSELAPGQALTAMVYYRVEESTLPGPLTLQVSATARTRFGAALPMQAEGMATVMLSSQPALEIVTASNPATATIGSDVIVTYRVRNTGDVTLLGVTLRDTRAGEIALPGAVLAPGEVMTGVAHYRVTVADTPGPLRSTATATAQTRTGQVVTAPATVTVAVQTNPGLTITSARNGVAGVGETVLLHYILANHGDLPVSDLEVIDRTGELLPLASTTLEPGATVAIEAAYVVTAADLPGPLLHTLAVRGLARDGQVVQVRGAAAVHLASPTTGVIHLTHAGRQTVTVGDIPLIVETPQDFALSAVTATHLDLTLAPAPPLANRRPEGMTVSGVALALTMYADGEMLTDAHFAEPLRLIVAAPGAWSWTAYRWDDLTSAWSRTDLSIIERGAETVTIGLQRPGIMAIFAPDAAAPAATTHVYLPFVRR